MSHHTLAHAQVEAFFDPATWTVSYLVVDPATQRAAIVDPVLDFDPKSGRTSTSSCDRLVSRIQEQGLTVDWILETHAHADHLSSAAYLKQAVGGKVAIGRYIQQVQMVFKGLFNLEPGFMPDGSQFDHLFDDGEHFQIGSLQAQALYVPGHTPADMAYLVDGAAFVATRFSCPMWAPPGLISQGAMCMRCSRRSAVCWPCPSTPPCSCAMTTRRPTVRLSGSPPWPTSARTTSMSMMV